MRNLNTNTMTYAERTNHFATTLMTPSFIRECAKIAEALGITAPEWNTNKIAIMTKIYMTINN